MSNAKRILIFGPIAVLTLLALAFSVYWFVIAGRISSELERHNGNEIVPAITLQFAEKNISGFPFRFDVSLSDVTLAARSDATTRSWQSEIIALHAASYGREAYLLEADGLQIFTWPAEDGASQHILQMTSGITRANIILEDNRLVRFNIDILNAEGIDASSNAVAMREFRIARAQIQLLAEENDTIAVAAELDAGEIGAGYRPALGTNLSRVRVTGRISQADLFHELRAGNAELHTTLDAWRNAGGAITLDPIEAAWGGTLLMGRAELTLDDEHRFAGLVTASPEDPVSFLGALAQSQMIPDSARAQLAGFREMAAGLPGNLNLPIRLETHFPLSEGPVTPQLRIEGMSGIVVEFGTAP